jgi:hypothetical protein
MQRIVIDIPDNKIDFFLELVKNLGFISEVKAEGKKLTRKQQEFIDDLKQSIKEVELHRQGKIKLQTASEFLNEL